MTTENHPLRGREGFTLVEVLIAMLILAVGLLGLEALGIGAAQSVNRANRQSAFAVMASDTLERTLNRIRRDEVLTLGTTSHLVGTSGREDTLRVEIRDQAAGTRKLYKVHVTVVPYPGSKVLSRGDSLRVNGYVFR